MGDACAGVSAAGRVSADSIYNAFLFVVSIENTSSVYVWNISFDFSLVTSGFAGATPDSAAAPRVTALRRRVYVHRVPALLLRPAACRCPLSNPSTLRPTTQKHLLRWSSPLRTRHLHLRHCPFPSPQRKIVSIHMYNRSVMLPSSCCSRAERRCSPFHCAQKSAAHVFHILRPFQSTSC